MSLPLSHGTPFARTHVTVIVPNWTGFSNPKTGVAICPIQRKPRLPKRREGEDPQLQIPERVRRLAVDPHLEVDVRAEAVAGAVAQADDLSLGDLLAG